VVYFRSRGKQQVASWPRDGVSHGARWVRHSSGHVFDASLR